MENLQMLTMIASSDLSKEQKDVLLKELANKIINERETLKENTTEEVNKSVVSDEKLKSLALKERIEGYKEKHIREEKARIKKELEEKRNAELEEKAQILSEIRNKNDEKVYADLDKMSGFEIESNYKIYEGTKELEDAQRKYEQKNNSEQTANDITVDELKQVLVKEDENPITMDDLNAVKSEPQKEGLGRKLVKSISTALDGIRRGMDNFKQVAYDETKLENSQNYVQENVRVRY